jgi:hypothetical protein
MENLPYYVYLVFGLTFLFAVILFYKAANFSKAFIGLISGWAVIQTIISLSDFYKNADTFPPRFALLVIPPLILIVRLFITKKGKLFIDNLNSRALIIFHIIRIPVEIVLFWLFTNNAIPELMTFEGRNFDIFSGLSAPFIYYFGFIKNRLSNKIILAWNFICLALLLNIVFHAVLSLPGPFQQLAFERPNIAVLHFPFVLLPACLVPMVLFSHLASIRQLTAGKKYNQEKSM